MEKAKHNTWYKDVNQIQETKNQTQEQQSWQYETFNDMQCDCIYNSCPLETSLLIRDTIII